MRSRGTSRMSRWVPSEPASGSSTGRDSRSAGNGASCPDILLPGHDRCTTCDQHQAARLTYSLEVMNISFLSTPDILIPSPISSSFCRFGQHVEHGTAQRHVLGSTVRSRGAYNRRGGRGQPPVGPRLALPAKYPAQLPE
jgi:hypothetical protein